MNLESVTPLVLTWNERANIERCLERLNWAPRVVVVDSGSTDGTREILDRYPNVDVFVREFDTFAAQCNYGLDRVATEWVLSLDADYMIPDRFVEEVRGIGTESRTGFSARFRYRVLGRLLPSSLYPPRIVLFRARRGRYTQEGHAHRLEIDGSIGSLRTRIVHDDRKPLDRWLRAQRRYASMEAERLIETDTDKLDRNDRLRRTGWIVPLLMPFYCLLGKGLVFAGRAGWYYTWQRTYAEVLLALELYERRSDGRRNEVVERPE